MKKVFNLVVALCMLITCLFTLTACGKEKGMTESQWKSSIVVDNFECWHVADGFDENGKFRDSKQVIFNGNTYNVPTGIANKYYTYTTDNGNYFKVTKENGAWIKTPVSEDAFKYKAEDFATMLNFVRNGFSKFTKVENRWPDLYYYNDTDNSLEQVNGIVRKITGKADITIYSITVEFDEGETEVHFNEELFDPDNECPPSLTMYDFGEQLIDYTFENAMMSLENFTIKGGTGVDYGEYYFTEDKFRAYTPNNTDATRKEAFWQADYQNNVYTYYEKANGTWTKDSTKTKTQYDSARNGVYNLYFGAILSNFDEFSFTYENGWYKFTESIEREISFYDITYSNLSIKISNGVISEATWNLKLTTGDISTTHEFSLVAGNTTINLPTVNA